MDPRPIHSRKKIHRTFVFLLLAVLLHGLFFTLHLKLPQPVKPPVEIHTVDPAKLNAIRNQWNKKLLLDQSKAPSEKTPPKSARYFSKRNRSVEKEQRAEVTDVLPKPGPPGESTRSQQNGKKQQVAQQRRENDKGQSKKSKTRLPDNQPFPSLQNLGVSFRLHQTGSSTSSNAPHSFHAGNEETLNGGGGGRDQALVERDLPVGAENLLNTQESVYYGFYARLYEAIGPIWQRAIREVPYKRAVPPGDYTTVVDVILDRDGNLVNVKEMERSGIIEFDLAVDRSWRKISKFPNPPKGLLTEDGLLHTGWTFNVQVGSGFNMTQPPARRY